MICDGRGVPLAIQLTGAKPNDSQEALALVDAIHHCKSSGAVHVIDLIAFLATPAMTLRQSGKAYVTAILPLLAMRNTEHGSGLGQWRWVVERTFAWLNPVSSIVCPPRETR